MSSFSHCRDIVRAHDRDRYLATLFAPADKRDALFALYAFNHEITRVRDAVREPRRARVGVALSVKVVAARVACVRRYR